jgi:outer membrane protein LpxR
MLRFIRAALIVALLSSGLLWSTPVGATEIRTAPESETPAAPTGRQRIGYGRLTTNDLIGDGDDRWRTGSITSSRVWARTPWAGAAPSQFGDLLEFRLQGEIIAPADLRVPNPVDRPWAGKLSLGVFTHWARGADQFMLGGDLVVIGPQTNLDDLQKALHELLGAPVPSAGVLGGQIGNSFRPTAQAEFGRELSLGDSVRLRPFVEARAGDESLLRVGADLTIGSFGRGELMVRESITGQRYRAVRDPVPGVSFVVGGDIAKVFSSVYLPGDRGYALSDTRDRLRAGIHWQGEDTSVFYGATWLGREFQGQPSSQVVGSIRLQFQF